MPSTSTSHTAGPATRRLLAGTNEQSRRFIADLDRALCRLVTVEPCHATVKSFRGWLGLSLSRLRRSTARDRRAVRGKGCGRPGAHSASGAPTLTARRHARQSRRVRDRAPPDCCARPRRGQARRPGCCRSGRPRAARSASRAGDQDSRGSGSASGLAHAWCSSPPRRGTREGDRGWGAASPPQRSSNPVGEPVE